MICDCTHKCLPLILPLAQEGVAKINREVRYMSCIFWVLSASKAKEAKTDGGAGGSARTTPTMYSLLQSTNTPVFDFFLQTSQLGKLAEKLPLFQELLPAGGTAARLLKAFTTLEVSTILCGWVGGWVGGWFDGWVGGWMDVWMGRCVYVCVCV